MAQDPQPPTSEREGSVAALIARLSSDLAPVRPCWPARLRLLAWLAVEVLVVALAVAWMGARADLTAKLEEAGFAVQVAGLVSAGVAFAALALLAAIPGRAPRRAPAIAALAVFFAAVGVGFGAEPSLAENVGRFAELGWSCAALTIAFAAVPWVALFAAQRRGAPLEPAIAGALAGAASLALAAAALRAVCARDERWHLLVWHLGPVLVGSGASLLLALGWLSRWRRPSGGDEPSATKR
jgi:hypothetical protein